MRRLLVVFIMLLSVPLVLAAYTGTNIGPDVAELDGKKLQWEAGSFDYFVMFKSLMANNTRTQCDYNNSSQQVGCDMPNNPESDTCLPQSTFKLESKHVPPDAYVEGAYLVWSTTIDPNAVNMPTDNTATLTFTSTDGAVTYSKEIVAPRVGVPGTDANPGQQDFTFEGMAIESSGQTVGGYYTYRVDVTDFFEMIHSMGLEAGYGSDGISLLGDYTVSGVSCTNNSQYISQVASGGIYSSTVVCGWSLIMVYRSIQVEPKMVYIYNGFSKYFTQQVDLTVAGFEFPDKPMVKMSFAVNEGDPGIAMSTGCGSLGMSACPPEGLQVTGATTPPDSLVILQNECNPAKFEDTQDPPSPFNYSETYNSISSVYGWDDTFPTCIGGNPNSPDPALLEYTMDVDTFLMDAATDSQFDEQFKKGDTAMFFKIGANGDVVYTNYMVLSVDTKAPRFDIPPNVNTPSGREKGYCSCAPEADKVCFTGPFYYYVKIQNWGDDLSTNVTLQDKLTNKVSYVSGTTEMCTEWKEANVCKEWKKIEDKNGGFPLVDPYPIADILGYCDPLTMECPETIMVRFKVLPSLSLQKHEVIENTALINDDSGKVYKTNTSIPLRLVSGSCPSAAECENPDLTECGGVVSVVCKKDDDCGDGEVCNKDGECVFDADKFTKDATITFAVGKNSPINSSAIIIPAPSTGVVMGQFSMIDSTGSSDKFYYFESVKTAVEKEPEVLFSKLKLVYDANGDGAVSEGEPVVAEANSVESNYISFALKKGSTIYKSGVLHHFLIIADATYSTPNDVPVNAVFNMFIDVVEAFSVKDAGNANAVMSPTPMKFAEYKFEPTKEVFIFTKGAIDPAVPAPADINKAVAVMQIRTKAVKHSNTLEKIRIKTATKSVAFGEGIKTVRIYLDENKDGSSTGDIMVGSATTSSPITNLEVVLSQPVTYSENEEKHLLIVCDFSIPSDKMAQIEILGGKVYLDKDVDVMGLPLKSKEFWNKCEEGDITCGATVEEDEEGCSATVIDGSSADSMLYVFAALAGLLCIFRKKLFN